MKYLYLLLLILGSSFLYAQEEENLADSLHMEKADSLHLDRAEKADTTVVKPKRTFNAIVVKASIDSLVEKNRTSQPFVPLRQQLFLYHSAYHIAVLPAQDIYIQDHGFTVRQSPFGIGYELQKRMAFADYIIDGRSISFEESLYPYPASLATTEYGIGGQDMNFANLQFRKNELVTVDSLYGRFNASFQRGIWGGQNDNSTIEDIFLKFAVKGGNLQLHANALDWDIPTFQHEIFYTENLFPKPIREKSALVSLYWQNKWVNAGFQMTHVNWMAPSFTFNGVHNFSQVLVDKAMQFKALKVNLSYEHFNGPELQSWQDQFVAAIDLQDIGIVSLNYETDRVHMNSKLYISNPKALGYDNEWQYRLLEKTSVVANLVGMKSFDDALDDIHYKNKSLDKATLGVKLKNRYEGLVQVDFGMKSREVIHHNSDHSQSVNENDQTPYVDLIAYAPVSFHKMRTMINYKMEAPYFQSILDVHSYIDMPHNNRFLFGFSHTYRDKSFLDMGINETSVFFDDYETKDNLLDAYAGLQISKQFDIRFTVKNIMDQDVIFGTTLMPITYQLGIKWDFVN